MRTAFNTTGRSDNVKTMWASARVCARAGAREGLLLLAFFPLRFHYLPLYFRSSSSFISTAPSISLSINLFRV